VQDKITKYDVNSYVGNVLLVTASSGSIAPVVGRPVFSIFSYPSGPLTHDTGDPQGFLNGKLSTDYSGIIQKYTVDSLLFNGSARPTIYGSLRNTVSYKSLSLSFNIIYKLNYYFRRSSIGYYGLFNQWNANKDFTKRWRNPGDEDHTIVPSMPQDALNYNPYRDVFYSSSQALVDKGDHIRLQDLTLNYDFKKLGVFKNVFSKINIYGYMNNIGIIWKANHDGLDPDLYGASLPSPRSYSFGIKADF
jgi:hypothetical protein